MGQSEIKVLLVEDNPGDVRLIQELLKESDGVKFEFAHLPRLAELESRLQSFHADVLLLDLGLPESQGLETLMQGKAVARHLPIIILTGLFGHELGVEAVANGAQDYLVKGRIDGPLLVRAIRYAIERKRAEAAVRENEQKLSSIYDTVGDVIFHLAVEKDGRYRFISVNQAFVTTTGIGYAQVVGKLVNEILPEPSLTLVLGKYKEAIREKKVVRWEETSDYPTGRLTGEVSVASVFDDAGNCTHLVGGVHDITERKRAEEALLNAEKRYRTTLDYMLEGCQIIGFDWRYLYINDVAAKQSRHTKEELLGHTMMEIYPGIEDTQMFAELRRCMEKHVAHRMENEFIYPDGTKGWFHLSIEPVPEGAFILSEDITKEKQLEEELRKHREHLEELVKERTAQLDAANKELEAFSYSVSHDLRAPLRRIDGFSQAVLEDSGHQLNDKAKNYLDRARLASQEMGQLIDDLLRLSRVTRVEMYRIPVDMSALAEKIAIELRKVEPARQADFVISPGLVEQADPSLVHVLFENLLGNAWKFTRKTSNARIEIGKQTEEGKPVYFVRDNGAGFDSTYIHKLFAPFQRLHHTSEFEGTGIGLATVQRIVHRHGGRVWADGTVNKGATFYFTFSA